MLCVQAHSLANYRSAPLLLAALLLISCAGAQKSEWDNLDYSSVYRKAQQRGEYDTGYTPSYGSCVDDDIINCE